MQSMFSSMFLVQVLKYSKYKVLVKKMRHDQKLAISKKSTFFVLSSWNLVKIISSSDDYFPKVSWGLDKKYGSFTNGHFLNLGPFFDPDFR